VDGVGNESTQELYSLYPGKPPDHERPIHTCHYWWLNFTKGAVLAKTFGRESDVRALLIGGEMLFEIVI
jgi:hypothetical protein